jgi:hypothetical protein
MKPLLLLRCLALVLATLLAAPAMASSFTWGANATVTFDIALTLTRISNISFGRVRALTAATYVINTAGVVTTSGAGQWLYGTRTAGNVLIRGSATQTINISVGSYVANNGVTLSAATCSYNGGPSGACALTAQAAPTASGRTLLLGVTATVSGTQAAGSSAAPRFTLTVVYS